MNPMKNVNLELTEAEANALAGLLDLAVRANGLRSAADALAILTKLQAATQPQEKAQ